jgi:hypothetical protein
VVPIVAVRFESSRRATRNRRCRSAHRLPSVYNTAETPRATKTAIYCRRSSLTQFSNLHTIRLGAYLLSITMPTPSSNQPPGPPSPPAHSFSTCPDDIQQPSRSSWSAESDVSQHPAEHSDMGIQPDTPSAPAVGEVSIDGELPLQGSAIVEDSASVELSSRATTMSPRPQSSATAVTSPASNSTDADTVKDVSMNLDDGMGAHATAPPRDGPSSQQGRQSPDQPIHYSREGLDACDPTDDQDIPFSPTIPHYPTSRVGY